MCDSPKKIEGAGVPCALAWIRHWKTLNSEKGTSVVKTENCLIYVIFNLLIAGNWSFDLM